MRPCNCTKSRQRFPDNRQFYGGILDGRHGMCQRVTVIDKLPRRIFGRNRGIPYKDAVPDHGKILGKQRGFVGKRQNLIQERFLVPGLIVVVKKMMAQPAGRHGKVRKDSFR